MTPSTLTAWSKKMTPELKQSIYMERLLREAHFRHLISLNAFKGANLGWVVDDEAYLSKTSAGIIKTKRLGHRKYAHSVVPR